MNDELNTALNEIEESIKEDESIASGEGTDDTSSADDLDVEDLFKTSSDTPKKSASEIAEQQKEAWARKIASGERTLEQLESLPSAKWLISDVKKKLGISPTGDDIESKIKAHESKKQFTQDMETLKGLDIDVKREIVAMSKEFIEIGATPEKALHKALEKSKGIIETKETERKKRVESGQLPKGKTEGNKGYYTADQVAKMSQTEYNEFRKKEKSGEVIIKL